MSDREELGAWLDSAPERSPEAWAEVAEAAVAAHAQRLSRRKQRSILLWLGLIVGSVLVEIFESGLGLVIFPNPRTSPQVATGRCRSRLRLDARNCVSRPSDLRRIGAWFLFWRPRKAIADKDRGRMLFPKRLSAKLRQELQPGAGLRMEVGSVSAASGANRWLECRFTAEGGIEVALRCTTHVRDHERRDVNGEGHQWVKRAYDVLAVRLDLPEDSCPGLSRLAGGARDRAEGGG